MELDRKLSTINTSEAFSLTTCLITFPISSKVYSLPDRIVGVVCH